MPSLPLPPSDRYRWGTAQTTFAAVLAVGAVLALTLDLPLAQWLHRDPSPLPKDLVRVTVWGEAFANAIGVGIFVLAVYILDPVGRFAVPRLLTASWGAGLAADVVKLTIQRFRPREFDYVGGVLDTFGPLWNFGNGSGRESFPSAHAATTVGLAVALTWLYPRGRLLFAGLATLACLQRLVSSSHFLSDVLCGAAVGYLFGHACVGSGWLARKFDGWEASWRTRGVRSPADSPS
jgi:membrane-associated phospholipid phosphatase